MANVQPEITETLMHSKRAGHNIDEAEAAIEGASDTEGIPISAI